MFSLFRPYVEFLRRPRLAVLFAAAALTRMPISMTALSLTLYLRQTLGNFADAGLALGCYFVAIAAVAPALGRLIDRWGPRIPLLVTGWLQPLVLLALYFAAGAGLPLWLVLLLVVLAGVLPPPMTTITRTLWRQLFTSMEERRMAFSLDAIITELNFTLGPSLIGLVVAWYSPAEAFLVSIACNWLAFQVFLRSPLPGSWQASEPGERHWLGPLREGHLAMYLLVAFVMALCFGMFEVAYPAYAVGMAAAGIAGLLMALNGLGSAFGGALFGVWESERSVEQQFSLTLLVLALPFVLHAMFPALWAFLVVAFFGGLSVAPAMTALNLVTTKHAPAIYATETQTWTATFIVSGFGGGMSLGGYLIETFSLRVMFWSGALIAVSMALCAWWLQSATAKR